MKQLTLEEARFMRLHELYHWYYERCWFGQHDAHVVAYKRAEWDKIANKAMDYIINELLDEHGIR